MKKYFLNILILISIGVLLSGCIGVSVTEPDLNLVKKYKNTTPKVKDNEIAVYIIRSDSFQGGAGYYKVGIDEDLARMESGTYTKYHLKGEIHTISTMLDGGFNGVSNTYPYAYNKLDNYEKGKTYFFYLDNRSYPNKLEEINNELGMTFIMNENFQLIKTSIEKSNQASYTIPLFNPTLVDLNLMIPTDKNVHPSKNTAKIIFYRMEDNGAWMPGIWTTKKYIGSISNNSVIEIKKNQEYINFILNMGHGES